jgi:hypothetical protein
MDIETQPLWTTTREAMGKTWRIELWPDDGGLGSMDFPKSETLGKSFIDNQWVRVGASRPMDGRDATLLHELIHLASKTSQTEMKEAQVTAFGHSLYAFLRGFDLWRAFPWPDRDTNT